MEALKVPVTAGTINKELEEHPNFNSLLSISDILTRFGVDNLAVRLDSDKLLITPTPFITQIRGANNEPDYFSIVKKIDGDYIDYYDPASFKWRHSKKDDFLNRYLGVALLAEAREDAGEQDFAQNAKEEKRKSTLTLLGLIALPVIVCIASVISCVQYGMSSWSSLLFALLNLAGTSAGGLLLWYELDQHNPALQQICGAGKNTNCGSILQSKAAKIAGISWSSIGFSYFSGGLLLMLFTGLNSAQVLFTTGILILVAFPYTFFSIYYQWRIAQQWCVLCLFVQVILVLQLITLLTTGRLGALFPLSFRIEWLPAIITAYTFPFILATALMPIFKKARESRENISRLQRIKHSSQVFDALLSKQKQLSIPSDGLGITLGDPSASFKIIKVCNPYCGPCARAHVPMEALLENNPNVQVQIIFTASNKVGDPSAPPVKHLLAIAASDKGDNTAIKQGLNEWYLAKEKNYDQFAAKYPMNGELKQQEDKIDAMHKWCNETEISFTPTFFINGYQMPDIYTVEDLKYFLTV
nr:vitamin K epoxide reductase family protein [Chitinophaga polysaccharea]